MSRPHNELPIVYCFSYSRSITINQEAFAPCAVHPTLKEAEEARAEITLDHTVWKVWPIRARRAYQDELNLFE